MDEATEGVPASKVESARRKQFDVFLSYARSDAAFADRVFQALGRREWSVFMDKEIPNAEDWEKRLETELDRVRCVLVLWSPSARKSEWVQREATAAESRKVLVHATLDGLQGPGRFANLQSASLYGWTGEDGDARFNPVLKAIAEKVGSKARPGTLPPPQDYENVTEEHLALASSSWRRDDGPFPYQIHLRLVGSDIAMKRVVNVVYYFDPAYAENRPEFVDEKRQAYVHVVTDWRDGFRVYERANGWSVVHAAVQISGQGEILWLSRLVDIWEAGPRLDRVYGTWRRTGADGQTS